jgi:hypothetical protein
MPINTKELMCYGWNGRQIYPIQDQTRVAYTQLNDNVAQHFLKTSPL